MPAMDNVRIVSFGTERTIQGDESTARGAAIMRHGWGGTNPQPRVMSPTASPTMERRFHLHACRVCEMQLGGPLVVCAACGAAVHSHCSLAVMHNSICELCMAAHQQDQANLQQQQAAAHQLGLASARSAQLIGTAAGAVGAAGLAASRYLVAGASAGARSAWAGARGPPPGLEVNVPRPASLPPPLQADLSEAPRPPFVAEAAEGSRGREQQAEQFELRARAAADAAAALQQDQQSRDELWPKPRPHSGTNSWNSKSRSSLH